MAGKVPGGKRGPQAGGPVRRRDKPESTGPDAAQDYGESAPVEPDPRDTGFFDATLQPAARGLGPEAGGQAGDTTGVSRDEIAGPESVEELLEEGQAYEAGVISGVEDAPNADQAEVTTRQVPEDDVPEEYLDEDRDR
jgi:hypothetical protein